MPGTTALRAPKQNGSHWVKSVSHSTVAKQSADSHPRLPTTERYFGCKQNLGSPVNDRFKLRLDVQPRDVNVESAMVKGSPPVATVPCRGTECRDGGRADEQAVEANANQSETDVVEVRKGHCPHGLRRCSGLGASQSDSENKVNGQCDLRVGGSVGFGKLHDRTP